MHSRSTIPVLGAGLLLSLATSTFASNNGFLIGDAFFPTIITAEDAATLEKPAKEHRVFRHSWFGGHSPTFCGYAGFWSARIPDVDDAFAANLAKVYRDYREYVPKELQKRDGQTKLIETNPLRVLFYSDDFDFEKFSLLLSYNEGYKEEIIKFGHSKDEPSRIGCLVNSRDAVEDCWANASRVPGLKAGYPNFKPNASEMVTGSVLIQEPVKAIVLTGRHSLEDYYQPPEPEYSMTMSVVSPLGIVKYEREGAFSTWVKVEDKE